MRIFEPGREIRFDLVLLMLLLLAVLLLRMHTQDFWNDPWMKEVDLCYSADIARNLVETHHYAENRILPRAVLAGADMPTSVATKGFLQPMITAAFFLIFGISDLTAFLTSIPPVFLMLIPLYRLGRGIGGRELAVVTCVLYVMNLWTADLALSGLREPLYAYFLTEAVSLIISERPRCIMAGLACGGMYLTREFHVFPIILIVTMALARSEERLRFGLRTLAVYALVVSYWSLRDWLSGSVNPLNGILALRTESYPDIAVMLTLESVSSIGFLLERPGEVIRKLVNFAPMEFHSLVFSIMSPLILFAMIFSFLRRGLDREALIRWMGGILFVLCIAADIMTTPTARHFAVILPLLLYLGARECQVLLHQGGRSAGARAIVFGILCLASAVQSHSFDLTRGASSPKRISVADVARIRPLIDAVVPAGEPIFSNHPLFTAWYAGRPSVHTPWKGSEVTAVGDAGPVNWMVWIVMDWFGAAAYDESLAAMRYDEVQESLGFEKVAVAQEGSVKLLFYRRTGNPGAP